MKKNQKTLRFLIVITSLLGLNLLILGKAFAQSQTASLSVQPGSLTLAVPSSITFSRALLQPGNPTILTAVENPNNQLQTVQVADPWSGNQFHLNVSLQNLTNSAGDVIPYTDFGVVTLHANTSSENVDENNTNPAGTNNVDSVCPALGPCPLSYYYDATTSNPVNFPDSNFVSFPLDTTDSDATDAGSVSLPITLMQRTTVTPSAGFYSVGMALRANIPPNPTSGNYTGELVFSLDP